MKNKATDAFPQRLIHSYKQIKSRISFQDRAPAIIVDLHIGI